MMRVGLTGGIACGKSTVSAIFRALGAYVIDADQLAREALAPGSSGARAVARAFGPEVAPGGVVDRAKLGALVFGHARRRKRLEAIVHPRVFAAERRIAREIAARDPGAVIVFDAALLIESGAYRRMNAVIVVSADQRTQLARLAARDGLTRAEALARIKSQWPLADKRRVADYVIDGRRPREDVRRAVTRIYAELARRAVETGRAKR
ncbi:MAG: dephospho-CoA kinase [Nitrospirota bacterium]